MDKSSIQHNRLNQAQRALLSSAARGEYFFLELGESRSGANRVVFGGREICGPEYSLSRATFPYPTFEYLAEGDLELRRELEPWRTVGPGTLFAYRPGMRVGLRTCGGPAVKYFVSLGGQGVEAALQDPLDLLGGTVQVAAHSDVREIFDALIREGHGTGPYVAELCFNLFDRIRLKIAQLQDRQAHPIDPRRTKFLECKTLIDGDPARFRTIEDIGRAAGLGRVGMFRLFRKYLGVTPYQYLLRQKMNLAARELVGSGLLIKEVAERVGFDDPLHFSKAFRKIHGMPPVRLRRYRDK